jgi:hypothetical protein
LPPETSTAPEPSSTDDARYRYAFCGARLWNVPAGLPRGSKRYGVPSMPSIGRVPPIERSRPSGRIVHVVFGRETEFSALKLHVPLSGS